MSDLQRHQHCYDYAELEAKVAAAEDLTRRYYDLLAKEQAKCDRLHDVLDTAAEECDRLRKHSQQHAAEAVRLRQENAELRLALAASDSDGQYAKLYEGTEQQREEWDKEWP